MSKGTFHRPADGRIVSLAGKRSYIGRYGNMHYGVDIGAQYGWNIRAAFNGTVSHSYGTGDDRTIVIGHSDGSSTAYLHNSRNLVRVGNRVSSGDIIAKVGTAGTGPHLHFEYHPNGWYSPGWDQINATNALMRGTPNNGSSNPPKRDTPASGGSSSEAANLQRSRGFTHWPQRALQVRDFPRGTYWYQPPKSNYPLVPNAYRHALVVALAEAGYPYTRRTQQGAWEQVRAWLRGHHGYNTRTPRLSIGADFQRYLTDQGVYTGAIDGWLGPQSIWAITTWLNRIRGAYI